MNNMEYYVQRLKLVLDLFKDHQSDLLSKNQDKIRLLLEGYKAFENNPIYDPVLTSTIETFILEV